MAKTIIDGFDFFDWGINQKLMYFSKSNLFEAVKYIKKNQIKAIVISDDFDDLLFFKEIPFIEDLHIGGNLNDYTGVYFIEKLERLTINGLKLKPRIRLEEFNELKYLSIDWH